MIPLRVILALILLVTSSHSFSDTHYITLIQKEKTTDILVDTLREQADIEFELYEPFRRETVQVRGLMLHTLLSQYFDPYPTTIRLTAHDDYKSTLNDWDKANWVLITHENGRELGLRQQGPIRLLEKDYTGRDPENLRHFNDWVWMIKSIEAVQ
ncbi:hypothetical protein [Nitrincola sp. MINF-07-Sa-05]|uniref:hypothetical protein n=1 Tax=Nitrincola salilacus TaxID=3400273 RepID=UPI0039184F16